MGLLGKIGKVIIGGLAGGPAGAISVFTVEQGPEVLEGTVDVARQVVRIGTDVYRAIPPEAFALGGAPLHGLLKHVAEDELIFAGSVAGNIAIFSALTWPALGPTGATAAILRGAVPVFIRTGSLIGKLHNRLLNDQEWEMARYIFGDTLPDRSQIILTNLGNPLDNGNPFVVPSTDGTAFVNMGDKYVHDGTIPDGPVLFHELTHVWQLKQQLLSEIFIYRALGTHIADDDPYPFEPGKQFAKYNLEQQAAIVEAWTLGATRKDAASGFDADTVPRPVPPRKARGELTIQSPLFRYINGNIRRRDTSTRTGNGRSARQLLNEGGHPTIREMLPSRPQIWW
jgi:hypothetical protein